MRPSPRPLLRILPLLLCLAALCGAGCASTRLAESWIDPTLSELPHFQKVFVAYLGADAPAQRHAEDALAASLHGVAAVKAYELLPDASTRDVQQVKAAVRAAGCDGAIVLRLARVEQELSVTPRPYAAPYYSSFGGYWGHAQPYAYAADVHTDEIVHVETTFYSLTDDKLLYTSRSETFNPGSTARLVDEILAAIAKDLESKGLHR